MFDRAEDQLAALLEGTIDQLELPPELHRSAARQYQRVAEYLGAGDEFDDTDLAIYPQGSFRLGTVVLPLGRSDYDIDLVFRLAIAKEATTQKGLKGAAGERLGEFVRDCIGDCPSLTEGGRCWTLGWPRFHMDVLPSLPNPENRPHGILLTDRDLRHWQWSNPIGFANWFHKRMEKQLFSLREALAQKRGVNIEQVQEWEVKTSLQQTVQVLKRHRDLFFEVDPEHRPPSILLTTLAAHAYRREANLFEAVINAATAMPRFVENRDGIWWDANPVLAEENFADRWRTHPERRHHFVTWMQQVQQDLEQAAEQRGLDRVVARLTEGFGVEVKKAAESIGLGYRDARRSGTLASAAGTGTLLSGSGTRVRDHTFYGRH
jgi:hypothetical protein